MVVNFHMGRRFLLLPFLCIMLVLEFSLRADTSSQSPRPAADPYFGESKEQRDARMAWWREARFGMFIHWGIYSVPAGIYHGKSQGGGPGEWIMHDMKIPVSDYAAYAGQFNPVKFDAEAWAQLAQDAGMKYMVITAKHHDGFAMFPSKFGGFNIVEDTPFKRDPLAELAAACRKRGIRLGFYYSQNQDWHQPGGAAGGGHWDKAQDGDMEAYLKNVAVPQVRELLTHYGPDVPAVLWWDTPQKEMTPERADLFQSVVALKPGIITNNRLSSGTDPGKGYPGDTETPEQHIPPQGYPGRDWETCMTINKSWGYKKEDLNWKSDETLIRNLVDIASKGGNYLLNVGPDAEGQIPEPEIERLRAMGAWMKVNGEAVYGTKGSPFVRTFPWGRATSKGNRIYLQVFDWPKDGKLLVPMEAKISKAWLLADKAKTLSSVQTADGIEIAVPATAPDPIASVLAVETLGQVKILPQLPLTAAADGSFTLTAEDTEIINPKGGKIVARLQNQKEIFHVGYWTNPDEELHWKIAVKNPGKFHMIAEYASTGKNPFVFLDGDAVTKGNMESTGDWETFNIAEIGTVDLPSGTSKIVFKSGKTAGAFCNLRSIKLAPVK